MNIFGFSFSFIKFGGTEKYAKRLFEQGQPEIEIGHFTEPKEGIVKAYLWFTHGLPGTVSVRRKKMPWRLESDYAGNAGVRAGNRAQLIIPIPANKKDNVSFHLKYKSAGQYVLVVKWKHF